MVDNGSLPVKTCENRRWFEAWYGMVMKNSQWTFHIIPLSPQRSSGLLSWECCVWWATTSSDEFGAGLGWRASSSNDGKSQPSPVPPLKLRGLARFFSPLTIQYFIVFFFIPLMECDEMEPILQKRLKLKLNGCSKGEHSCINPFSLQ